MAPCWQMGGLLIVSLVSTQTVCSQYLCRLITSWSTFPHLVNGFLGLERGICLLGEINWFQRQVVMSNV
ncbi:hypothetical protein XELAEV_18041616mg [Xenopus laevis]|uniref:Secreted protein n=1 Tax=Xenopus laevis TaxID=8355 RepID=A0A974H5K1_XENLA|nr:hypothetical protein XELAEV_18041616mg [Xenopus laevis]